MFHRAQHALVLIISPPLLFGQAQLSGRVLDAENGAPLPYVSLGLIKGAAFTLSRPDGSFTLPFPADPTQDSLLITCVGFERLAMLLSEDERSHLEIRLKPVTTHLSEFEVVASRVEERTLGVRTHHALFNYQLEAHDVEDVLEIAQVVDLGPVPIRITAVNAYISGSPMDTATFRIGFRAFDGEQPARTLVDRSLVRTIAVRPGWQRFDLVDAHIALSGEVVLTLEVLSASNGARSIAYGIRLGGGEPGFDRRTTFAAWQRPPHRYSLNVSARVPVGRPREAPEEEEAYGRSVSLRLWSPAVQDSFHIAIGLPDDPDPAYPGGYPTVYLLDANVFFADVVHALRKEARKKRMPPMIVVGIGYRDFASMDTLRQRDDLFPASASVSYSGGGERFLRFVEDQLVPWVDAQYPTDTTRRIVAGHSNAGYFPLYALHHHRESGRGAFHGFIAASPEVGFADGYLVNALRTPARNGTQPAVRVFVSYGREEGTAVLHACIAALRARSAEPEQVIERVYPEADHMDTALPSFMDGVREVLE